MTGQGPDFPRQFGLISGDDRRALGAAQSMIPKSGYRFSEKIMLQE
jgi:hypothetical protein